MSIQDLTPWHWGKKGRDTENDLHPIQTLHHRIDHLFNDFMEGWTPGLFGHGTERALAGSLMTPRIDVIEEDREYRFMAELPGVDDDDIDLTIADGILSLRGEKKSEFRDEMEDDTYLRIERSYGTFERSFSLPVDADEDQVAASFDKGVLTIKVPKNEKTKAKAKKIKLKKAA